MPIRSVIRRLISDEFEGGANDALVARGDEFTVFGISSKFRPDFTERYKAAAAKKDEKAIAALKEEAVQIYMRDYVRPITGWDVLNREFPALLALLFLGRVHGAGFRHYVSEIQAWANSKGGGNLVVDGMWGQMSLRAVLVLTTAKRTALIDHLNSDGVRAKLVQLRQIAVRRGGTAGVERGVGRRVLKELRYAKSMQDGSVALAAIEGDVKPLEVPYAEGPDSADSGILGSARRSPIHLV